MEGGEGGPCKGDLQMLHNPIDKDEGVSQAASSSPHSRPNGDSLTGRFGQLNVGISISNEVRVVTTASLSGAIT
ncbi:hypothetical protein I7I48_12079 [Histoplasma ohiense]|nr:hypothetical protein I7I48_12079 [Histoplasma ohiense (nom. inval.)]